VPAKTSEAAVQNQPTPDQPYGTPSSWDYQADVVVIGAGAAGVPAAIAASQAGASVLIVEKNYDVGGRAIMSAGSPYFGAGNSAQIAYKITDSPDLFFSDLTTPAGTYYTFCGTHYVDREMARVIADNMVSTWDWLLANGVQWTCTALPNTPPSGPTTWTSGTPRTESPYWNGASSWPASAASPGGANGTGLMRPLEATARSIGVQFLMNYRMTSIIREQPYSGSVLGVTAQATGGRFLPGSNTPLQPYMSQGNITLQNPNVNIRANKAVIICDGGAESNVDMRRETDPRLTAVYQVCGEPFTSGTGDGIYAARRIGASLWATGGETAENDRELYKPTTIGCQYTHGAEHFAPTSPIFPLVRAQGITVSNWDGICQVNMAGARFFNESAAGGITPVLNNAGTTLYNWLNAAMSINAASTPPDYAAGPIWTIFDSAAVTRENWTLGYPYTDPLFFFEASTIAGLAPLINTNSFQTTSMDPAVLTATVNRYNSLVTAGKGDTDFGKTPFTYQINTPPYYAAWSTPEVWIFYSGLHINTEAQVLDLDSNVIPGLYAAGDSVGGSTMHGLTKHLIYARIAGANAAQESPL